MVGSYIITKLGYDYLTDRLTNSIINSHRKYKEFYGSLNNEALVYLEHCTEYGKNRALKIYSKINHS